MGKQTEFYMTTEDEEAFVAFIRSDRGVGIYEYAIPSKDITYVDELPDTTKEFGTSLFLRDRENSPTPILRFVQEQGYFVTDRFESEVIEFSRCHFAKGCLVRGRIWAEMSYWIDDDPPRLVKKDVAFQKWFSRLSNWIKRNSQRNTHGEYVMSGAAAFAADGGRLCQAVFNDGSVI